MKSLRLNDIPDKCMYCEKWNRCPLYKRIADFIDEGEPQGVAITLAVRSCKYFKPEDAVIIIDWEGDD